MKLPNANDMSREQMDIYLDAPTNGFILVTGPPGTGKTVIAFYRARAIAEEGRKVVVLMYNKVLRRYTENAANGGYGVKTLHSWTGSWWQSNFGPGSRTPMVDGNRWEFDWEEMLGRLVERNAAGNLNLSRAGWGHLVIDEAQDFSPSMFNMFNLLAAVCFRGLPESTRPALTVFADENQRLTREYNATVREIVDSLGIDGDRCYELTRNYRNSRPIAQLASAFYVGLSTGIPECPTADGETPVLVRCGALNDAVDYIKRYAINHDDQEIGVIVQNDKIRKKIFNKLDHRLKEHASITVQTYSSKKSEKHNNEDSLLFDQPGTISVLNQQSCKGLEFDAVFLPEIQQCHIDPAAIDVFKMQMYVMIARARRYLALMYSSEGLGDPAILRYLPGEREILERIDA